MEISPTNPVDKAWHRMVLVLFNPFKPMKWLCLALGAFLWNLGISGFGGNYWSGLSPNSGSGSSSPGLPAVMPWFHANMGLAVVLGLVGLFLFVAMTVLFTWLRCRGTFVFIHQLVKNTDQIAVPWADYADLGNNLTGYSLMITILSWAGYILIGGVAAVIAMVDIQHHVWGPGAIAALVIGIPVGILWTILGTFVTFMLDAVVAPAMYARRLTVSEIWPELWEQLIKPQFKNVALFTLLMVGIAIGTSIVVTTATCCTCCCAAIPYVGSLILLPLFVFRRLCGIYFLDQLGGVWSVFTAAEGTCPACNYSLQGLLDPTQCPECGAPIAPRPNHSAPVPPPPAV